MSKLEDLSRAVETGKAKLVPGLVQEALEEGHDPAVVLNVGMIEAMDRVGAKFKSGEIFVPEMMVAARAMKNGVEILKPHLAGDGSAYIGKFVMGTVYGDLHDIGKNLVIMMVEASGFEVRDLGIDVTVADFVEAVENDPEVKIVGVSALLTTTMPAMQETVEALNRSPVRSRFKVMVGGAPVTAAFAEGIGADAYTADAAEAAQRAKELLGELAG